MLNMATTNDPGRGGLKDIAGVLGGGIQEGSLALVEGESKTGKSVLSQHIAYGVLHSKECGVAYYTTDFNSSGLVEQMDSLSLDVRHDLVTDRLRVYQINTKNAIKESNIILNRLLKHFSTLPGRFKLVIVDSASPFLTRVKTLVKMDFLQSCKQLCEKERSIILVLDTHVFDEDTLARAHQISDYYLKLKTPDMMMEAGRIDPRVIKTMEVTKLAGAERRWQPGMRFEIRPKMGIQILPFVQVKI
jgi:archaellum biogenesis ATPase FlaH